MKKNIFIKAICIVSLHLVLLSCTEPYALQSNSYESALVVEATLTNELKQHEVKISKTFQLGERQNETENGAIVKMHGDNGTVYDFEQTDGIYRATTAFQAAQNVFYHLTIETADGNHYVSDEQKLPATNALENITATKTTVDGVSGVQIAANSFDATNSSKYYRYTFEETYKVIVPNWSPNKLLFTNADVVIIALRDDPQTRVCYSTNSSKYINITSTADLSEDRVSNYPIHFIPQNDNRIANRYSILVKQYVQNYEAFNFYRILKSFSSSENILSQVQPGFIYGNIQCTTNPNEKIIGLFDVATVSERRIFFNYEDLFPGELRPDYIDNCEIFEFDAGCFGITCTANGYHALKSGYLTGKLAYYQNTGNIYKMVKPVCGDCTTFSSNLIPPFWQ